MLDASDKGKVYKTNEQKQNKKTTLPLVSMFTKLLETYTVCKI